MTWQNFLDRAAGQRIDIVGPFFDKKSQVFEDPVIFIDRGTKFRRGHEGFSIGDGDSFPEQLDHRLPADKNISDLGFVLSSLPLRFREVRLLGFLGGRRDHELFNFGEAHNFLKKRAYPHHVQFDEKVTMHAAGSWQLELNGLFSLGVIEKAMITLHGNVRYSLPEPTEISPLSSLGLSNVAAGMIGIHASSPFLLFLEQA